MTGNDGAAQFYRKNRKRMVAGMKLSAPAAFRRAEKTRDPLLGAMRAYHKMGHDAFWAERQQEPQRRQHSMNPSAKSCGQQKQSTPTIW